MPVKISYLNKTPNTSSSNLVIFSDEKFKVNNLKRYLSSYEFSYVSDLLKTSDLKKNLIIFEISSKKK